MAGTQVPVVGVALSGPHTGNPGDSTIVIAMVPGRRCACCTWAPRPGMTETAADGWHRVAHQSGWFSRRRRRPCRPPGHRRDVPPAGSPPGPEGDGAPFRRSGLPCGVAAFPVPLRLLRPGVGPGEDGEVPGPLRLPGAHHPPRRVPVGRPHDGPRGGGRYVVGAYGTAFANRVPEELGGAFHVTGADARMEGAFAAKPQ